jgi:ankyrin repeat protein
MQYYQLDNLEKLPADILYTIIKTLKPKQIVQLCYLSTTLNKKICRSKRLWKELYQRDISYIIPDNVKEKYISIIKFLDSTRDTQAIEYAAENHFEILLNELLTKSVNFSKYDYALYGAAKSNHKDLIQQLITQPNVDLNLGLDGAMQGKHTDLVWYFLSLYKGEDTTILPDIASYAAQNGEYKLLKYLVEKLELNPFESIEYVFQDPLYLAAKGNHTDIIEYLLRFPGYDANRGLYGASEAGGSSAVAALTPNGTDLIKYFMDQGANNFNQALEYAARGNHDDIIQYFLNLIPNPELDKIIKGSIYGNYFDLYLKYFTRDYIDLQRALAFAVSKKRDQFVQHLLDNGAKVDSYICEISQIEQYKPILDLLSSYCD